MKKKTQIKFFFIRRKILFYKLLAKLQDEKLKCSERKSLAARAIKVYFQAWPKIKGWAKKQELENKDLLKRLLNEQ